MTWVIHSFFRVNHTFTFSLSTNEWFAPVPLWQRAKWAICSAPVALYKNRLWAFCSRRSWKRVNRFFALPLTKNQKTSDSHEKPKNEFPTLHATILVWLCPIELQPAWAGVSYRSGLAVSFLQTSNQPGQVCHTHPVRLWTTELQPAWAGVSYPGLGKCSFQKNATFLRSFAFFIKECGVLCVLLRSL